MRAERERILEMVASGQLTPVEADRLLRQAEGGPGRTLLGWLFDPIDRLGTRRSSWVGLVAMLLGVGLSRFGVRFDGTLDSHMNPAPTPISAAIADALVAWPLTALVFWLVSLAFAKRGRFVDHMAIVGLSRVPVLATGLLLAVMSTFWPMELPEPGNMPDIHAMALVLLFASIPFVVWQVVLLYRGFRTASGLRGPRCIVAGIAAILAAEVLSKVALWGFGKSF